MMIGSGPPANVLEGLPVSEAFRGPGIQPASTEGNTDSDFGGLFFSGFLATLEDMCSQPAAAVVGDEHIPRNGVGRVGRREGVG